MLLKRSFSLSTITLSPSVIVLLCWMIVPLGMTIYFSLLRYNLLSPGMEHWAGLDNYFYFMEDPAFFEAIFNTFWLLTGVLLITILFGLSLALLLENPIVGKSFVQILIISPFFVMPTVSALMWKNLMMNPVNGLLAYFMISLGLQPIHFFGPYPMWAIIIIVSWQWAPFAFLIFITSLQSLDIDQIHAAQLDGANYWQRLRFIVLPYLKRPIAAVLLIETIFILSVFAEILVTTNGGPGFATTNITFLIYAQSLLNFDVGAGAAGGVIAVILASIVSLFLIRMIGKNLDV